MDVPEKARQRYNFFSDYENKLPTFFYSPAHIYKYVWRLHKKNVSSSTLQGKEIISKSLHAGESLPAGDSPPLASRFLPHAQGRARAAGRKPQREGNKKTKNDTK